MRFWLRIFRPCRHTRRRSKENEGLGREAQCLLAYCMLLGAVLRLLPKVQLSPEVVP